MFRPAVISSRPATFDGASLIDSLVDDLVARGADLHDISLDEMKRQLASALRTQRSGGLGAWRRWSCPSSGVHGRVKLC